MLYLDYCSSAPLRPEALAAMQPWLSTPGNPASAHAAGRNVRKALENAREQIASLLDAFPDEVVFTSGATEANNLAIFGLCVDVPGRIVASPIEHPCVIEPLKQLEKRGFAIDWLPVSEEGVVPADALASRPSDDVRLVAVMLANHETGAIQPVAELTGANTLFHCDAAQAAGKMNVDFHQLGATTLSISAHKFGGPVGIGALLVSRCAKIRPLLFGGHQQHGRRPGTEPVALAVGMAAALTHALQAGKQVAAIRKRFVAHLHAHSSPIIVNGPLVGGLPHILNVSFPGCRADALLAALDLAGVACSTGSACSSGSLLPSPVLKAMGVTGARLHSAMRFSFGPGLSESEVDQAAGIVATVVHRVRSVAEEDLRDAPLA
jgi:cysteine desulfurase